MPSSGDYVFDFLNGADIIFNNVIIDNAAGIARFGASTTQKASRLSLLHWKVTLSSTAAASTDQLLFRSGANATLTDWNVTGDIPCADIAAGLIAFRPAANAGWDTFRGTQLGFQCFKVGVGEFNANGDPIPPDGRKYGLILDTSAGGTSIFNIWFGPTSFIDHTTLCNVQVKTAAGASGIIRNIFLRGNRFTADSGTALCADNTGGNLIRSFDYSANRVSISDVQPHVTISGTGWLGATMSDNSFVDNNNPASKPKSISLGSDGWIIQNNNWASSVGTTTAIQTAISVDSAAITIAQIAGNYAPYVPTLIAQPVYTLPDRDAPQRQISRFAPQQTTKQLAADFATSSTTTVAPPAMVLPVRANTLYEAKGYFVFTVGGSTSPANNGAAFSFALLPTSPAPQFYVSNCAINTSQAGTAAPVLNNQRTPTLLGTASTTADTVNAAMLATCTVTFRTGALDGTIGARMKTSNSGSSVTLLAGSSMILNEVR